jgi:hypothetical protein
LDVERSAAHRGTRRGRVFRGKIAAEASSLFRNTKVAEIIHPPDVNNMSESSP